MAYSANADLQARTSDRVLIQLTDDEKLAVDTGTLATAIIANAAIQVRITAAIADADAMVNTYLRKQYAVPLATTPDTIKRLSVDLAMHQLHGRRGSDFGEPPEAIIENRKQAIKVLEGINKGEIDLGVDTLPGKSSSVIAVATGEDRIFTAETMDDF